MNLRKILTLSFLVLLSACGGNGNDDILTGGAGSAELNGTWLSNCYFDPFFNVYSLDEIFFSNEDFSIEFWEYDNSSCEGNPISSGKTTGTLIFGEFTTTGSGLEASEIDFLFSVDGQIYQVLDIAAIEGNALYFGVFDLDAPGRPNELDFEIQYFRI